MSSAYPTNWRTLIGSANPKFMVKGHELAVTLYGEASRFAVYEVRSLEADGYCGTRYRIRDAETVSDADVRAGKFAQVVADGLTWTEVEAFVGASTDEH
jgi:hypothetical protein